MIPKLLEGGMGPDHVQVIHDKKIIQGAEVPPKGDGHNTPDIEEIKPVLSDHGSQTHWHIPLMEQSSHNHQSTFSAGYSLQI